MSHLSTVMWRVAGNSLCPYFIYAVTFYMCPLAHLDTIALDNSRLNSRLSELIKCELT